MDKLRTLFDWKILLPLVIFLGFICWISPTAFRKVGPYRPPQDRDISLWGTMNQQTVVNLQTVLDTDVNRLNLPGLQVSIQTAEGLTWSGVAGTTDTRRRDPLTSSHIIRVGSVTKTFTAVIILQLVEDGQITLDDLLSKWFADFPEAGSITIRELLSHRSGIYEILRNPAVLVSLLIPQKYWKPDELVKIASQEKPGAQGEYSYSNTNYILLGLIAERVTEQDMASLYRERILEPLRMNATYFIPYEDPPETLISGYDRDMLPLPGIFKLKPGDISAATAAYTSGAMASTADDLRIFYDGLFSGKLISPAMVEQMAAFFPANDPGTPQLTGYGLGLFRLDVEGEQVWASLGEFIGSMTMIAYSPGNHDIVAIVGNLSLYDYVSVWKNMTAVFRESMKEGVSHE